jgi:hypothetical protein
MIRTLRPRTLIGGIGAQESARLLDSCGCKMGAAFVGVGLLASTAWYGWRWHLSTLPIRAMVLRIITWSVAAGLAGKIVGILIFRMRSR